MTKEQKKKQRKKKSQYLWLKVSNDKYELPLVVEESARDLADKCGVHVSNIIKGANKDKSDYKINVNSSWRKVKI